MKVKLCPGGTGARSLLRAPAFFRIELAVSASAEKSDLINNKNCNRLEELMLVINNDW